MGYSVLTVSHKFSPLFVSASMGTAISQNPPNALIGAEGLPTFALYSIELLPYYSTIVLI